MSTGLVEEGVEAVDLLLASLALSIGVVTVHTTELWFAVDLGLGGVVVLARALVGAEGVVLWYTWGLTQCQ